MARKSVKVEMVEVIGCASKEGGEMSICSEEGAIECGAFGETGSCHFEGPQEKMGLKEIAKFQLGQKGQGDTQRRG